MKKSKRYQVEVQTGDGDEFFCIVETDDELEAIRACEAYVPSAGDVCYIYDTQA